MMKHLLLLILFCAIGCGLPSAHYFVELKEVEADQPRQIKIDKHNYEDDRLKSTWIFNRRSIGLKIENKTDSTMRILWDQMVYVDEGGFSRRVIHSNIRFVESGNAHQVPSIIVKKSKLADIVVPVDNIYWDSGWKKSVLIKPWLATDRDLLEKEVKKNIGTRLQLLLPVEIHGRLYEYLFQFEITGYYIERVRGFSEDLIGRG